MIPSVADSLVDAIEEDKTFRKVPKQGAITPVSTVKIETVTVPEPVVKEEVPIVATTHTETQVTTTVREATVQEEVNSEEPEKKKGLGQAIKKLFKKKKKLAEDEDEQQQTSES